uniref:ARAD1A16016p n=1 Tax=Blastobotrys adeninivorans TaxID=409370 RepID=A0A060T3J1_BLAAD
MSLRSVQSTAKKPVRRDKFSTLSRQELVNVLRENELPSDEVVKAPTQQNLWSFYEAVFFRLLATDVDQMKRGMDEIAEHMDSSAALQAEARHAMGFYRRIASFMIACGVHDFSILDLTKPDQQRNLRNLSAVAHFIQWARTQPLSDFANQTEELNVRLQNGQEENDRLQDEIRDLEEANRDVSRISRESHVQNSALEDELRALKRQQEELQDEHTKYKSDKHLLIKSLENTNFLLQEAKSKNERLRPYVLESAENLQNATSEMAASLETKRKLLQDQEDRLRALEVTTRSLRDIEAELRECVTVLQDCVQENARLADTQKKLYRIQEIVSKRQLERQNLDLENAQLERQVASATKRIEKAQAQAHAKQDEARERMKELNSRYYSLRAQRDQQDETTKQRRHRIDAIESEIAALQQQWEVEVKSATKEVAALQARIDDYVNDMTKRLD